jgi:peptidoglycan/xylan/chitin deacetylase (PgdA/CDA1 family)
MKYFLVPFLILLTLQTFSQPPSWPRRHKACIVLTYDDALESQLKVAAPQLKAAHLPATFFLTGDIDTGTIPQWRALAHQGFELGNHTLYHPCLSTEDNPVHSENYTIESMLREIELMNNYLFAIDGHTARTYAYPCAESSAGGKDYVDSLRDYELVKYARMGGDTDAVITDFKHLDLLRVPSFGLEGNNTGAQLIKFVKRVQRAGGMGIIMFHGVGGDYITVSAAAHQELLKYLAANRRSIWVATFLNAMDYVTRKTSHPKTQLLVKVPRNGKKRRRAV